MYTKLKIFASQNRFFDIYIQREKYGIYGRRDSHGLKGYKTVSNNDKTVI